MQQQGKTPHYVVHNKFNYGTVDKDATVKWKFQFTDPSKIEGIDYGCTCTQPSKLDMTTGILEGTLELPKAINNPKQGLNSVNKTITVYYKDGKPIWSEDGNGFLRLTRNKDKKQDTLHLMGDVLVPREVTT